MIEIWVHDDQGNMLGPFEMPVLPEIAEIFTVPSNSHSSGVQIFRVSERQYLAKGANWDNGPTGPTCILDCEEIH